MNPAIAMVLLIFLTGLGTAWMAKGYDVRQCKIDVSNEKRKRQEELSQKRLLEMQKKIEAQKSKSGSLKAQKKLKPGTDHYGSIFSPTNLEGQVGSDNKEKEIKDTEKKQYQNIFAPTNLENQVKSENQ